MASSSKSQRATPPSTSDPPEKTHSSRTRGSHKRPATTTLDYSAARSSLPQRVPSASLLHGGNTLAHPSADRFHYDPRKTHYTRNIRTTYNETRCMLHLYRNTAFWPTASQIRPAGGVLPLPSLIIPLPLTMRLTPRQNLQCFSRRSLLRGLDEGDVVA